MNFIGCELYLNKPVIFIKRLTLKIFYTRIQFSSVQSLSHVRFFAIPWTAACEPFLSFTISRSLLKLCLWSRRCHPTISSSVAPFSSSSSIFYSIRVFYNQLALHKEEENKGPRCETPFLSQKKEQEQFEIKWKLWASQKWAQTASTVRLAPLGALNQPLQFVPKAAKKGFTLEML